MTLTLPIEGMHCAGCVNGVEGALRALPGVAGVAVSLPLNQARLEFDETKLALPQIKEAVAAAGYAVGAVAAEGEHQHRHSGSSALRQRFFIAVVFTLPIFIISMLHLHFPYRDLLLLLLTLPVQFWCAAPFLRGALQKAKFRTADMNTLIALGTFAAFAYSAVVTLTKPLGDGGGEVYFESAAVIVTLILLGRLLEERASGRAKAALEKLLTLKPSKARLWYAEQEMEVPLDSVAVGDVVIVKPGDRIPVDGQVTEGRSDVDESMLTGESVPVTKEAGARVFAGTLNASGALRFRATEVGAKTQLARIIALVEEAQTRKAPVERLADRVAGVFVPIVILLALLAGGGWLAYGLFGLKQGWAEALPPAFTAFVATLIIACPCALGLATPTAVLVGTGRGAELGILIRGGDVLEKAGHIRLLLCDKTGTLTVGKPRVEEVVWFAELNEAEKQRWLSRVGTAERQSNHPWAKAIAAHCPASEGDPSPRIEELLGRGVRATFGAGEPPLRIGNAELMKEAGIEAPSGDLAAGQSAVFFAAGDRLLGCFKLADAVRAEAADAVGELRREGIDVWMVTGDQPAIAQEVAKAVGISRALAGVKPGDKAEAVRQAQATGLKVAFLGDGINDAPALAAADLGIAMGTGTDAAMEAGDIVLARGDLRQAATAVRLARRTLGVIHQNLFFAFGYNVLAIPLAMANLLDPMIAAGAMALSSVSVVANSLRLRRFG